MSGQLKMIGLLGVIFTGAIVYILSQYYFKVVLGSVSDIRKLLSEISRRLLFYQDKICNASTEDSEIPNKLSDLSARLSSALDLMPRYMFLVGIRHIFKLPKRDDLLSTCQELTDLSYGMRDHGKNQNRQAIKNVMTFSRLCRLLPIETAYKRESPLKSGIVCEV